MMLLLWSLLSYNVISTGIVLYNMLLLRAIISSDMYIITIHVHCHYIASCFL